MTHRTLAIAVGLSAAIAWSTPSFIAQERVDSDINAKIRKEATGNSKILHTMHYLTDVYGPRLTGSPNLKAAGEWAIKEMASWGFVNGRLEPWDFGRPGWVNEVAVGAAVTPFRDKLEFEVLAWTPSTDGTVKEKAFNMVLPTQPTKDELEKYLESVKDNVKGAIVLVGKSTPVPVNLEPPAKRTPDDVARGRYNGTPTGGGRDGRGGRGALPTPREGAMPAAELNTRLNEYLLTNKVKLRINDGAREHGQIRAFQNNTYDVDKVVPTVVMRNEDYGRIARVLADGTPVELEFTIKNKVYADGKTAYNTISEIAGSDKKDEVVMLGGHLDSWHSATGATDNAIGCAVMMEAARILKAIGVQPRRTIRVALWSGEEQGLLGSQAYVKEHFGIVRGAEARVLQARRLHEHRLGHRPRPRRQRLRSAGCCRRRPRPPQAVRGHRRHGRLGDEQPRHRRYRFDVIQQRRPRGHRLRPGPDRVQQRAPGTRTSIRSNASSSPTPSSRR